MVVTELEQKEGKEDEKWSWNMQKSQKELEKLPPTFNTTPFVGKLTAAAGERARTKTHTYPQIELLLHGVYEEEKEINRNEEAFWWRRDRFVRCEEKEKKWWREGEVRREFQMEGGVLEMFLLSKEGGCVWLRGNKVVYATL